MTDDPLHVEEAKRIRAEQEAELDRMKPNVSVALDHLGIKLPDGVDPLPVQTGCYVCDGIYSVGDANDFLPMCSTHAGEYQAVRTERLLRAAIPPDFHDAKPSDLSDDLQGWDCATGLYLYGPVGTGKSHAAAAMTKRWYVHQKKLGNDPTVHWMNVPTAILLTLAEFGKGVAGKPATLWDAATSVGLLVLDDIGVEQPKEWVRTRLYGLVEHRKQQRLTTIVTSNLDLGGLADRLDSPQIASRLRQLCAPVSFDGKPDRRPGLGPKPMKG